MSAATAWNDGHFIGGDPALDLTNTVWRRRPEVGADLLSSPSVLDSWLTRSGTLDTDPPDRATDAQLSEIRQLRELIWEAFDRQRGGFPVTDDLLGGILAHVHVAPSQVAQGGDLAIAADGTLTARSTQAAQGLLALRALRLLLSPPPRGVGACNNCGWLFIDSSRSGRRRWCSMRTCGNQNKVHRHRATRSRTHSESQIA